MNNEVLETDFSGREMTVSPVVPRARARKSEIGSPHTRVDE